jgi:LysM repeat protein
MPIKSRRAGWVTLALLLSLALTGCYQSLGGSLEPTQAGVVGVEPLDSTPLPQPGFTPAEGAPTEEQLTPDEPAGPPTLTPFPTLAPATDTPAPTDTVIAQPTDVLGGPLDGQGGAVEPTETPVIAVAVVGTPTPLPPSATPSPTSTHTPLPTATSVPLTNTPPPTQPPTVGPTLTFTPVPFLPFAATATYTPYYASPRPVEAAPLAERPLVASPVVVPTQTPPVAAPLPTQPIAVAQVPTATPTEVLAEAQPLAEVALQATLTAGQMTATQIVYEATLAAWQMTATAAATLGVAPPAVVPGAGPGVIYVTATPPIAGQQVIYVTATPALAGGICGEHFVLPGETLSRLAQRYGVAVNQFAQANNIVNPDLIRAGDTLLVPCAVPATATPPVTPFAPDGQGGRQGVYTVQPGDNIYRISLQFGITMSELMAANGILPAQMNFITVGQELIIPGAAAAPAPTAVPGTGGGPVYIVITETPTPLGFVG